ncbi:uncharacterized protein FIESC28_11630 [Fusarium coffeatum]|uniref:Chromo domain-containing protein n=1 Tax=Fusarium coffeatum TaxID=231269 RepID=A0A366QH84_9HYPO|nr:uncharacterized protein FIESC28_11630 [Fusarium coffeatum]RBR04092.1 hypothetical protein FIESC28_11630 [Fusarium coffeatum]
MPTPSAAATAKALTDASEREITSHHVSQEFRAVIFTAEYTTSTGKKITEIPEKNLQEIDEPLVLAYWKQKGGRATTGLGKDGILKVLDEMKRYWVVQWVGYPADEDGVTCETKDVVARKCPEAIIKWRNSLSREQLYMVQDFSIGIGGMGGIPGWALELPTIDEDDLTEAEEENLGIF